MLTKIEGAMVLPGTPLRAPLKIIVLRCDNLYQI